MSRSVCSFLCVLTFFLGAAAPLPARADDSARVALQAKMTQTRLRLLQTDSQLQELDERIKKLQQEMIERLDANPEMAALRKQLDALPAAK